MPLIVFIGISSVGAVFLIVVLAQFYRDERHRSSGTAVHYASSTHRLLPLAISPGKSTNVVVLRRTIQYRGQERRPTSLESQPLAQVEGDGKNH